MEDIILTGSVNDAYKRNPQITKKTHNDCFNIMKKFVKKLDLNKYADLKAKAVYSKVNLSKDFQIS